MGNETCISAECIMLPVQQLYQHVKTKDPKLYQALDAICQSINAPTIAGVATVIATAAIPIEGGTTTGAAAGVTYSLGMQGTLAIATDIAPKVYIPATFVPSVLRADVKQAPTGASLVVVLSFYTVIGSPTVLATFTITDGTLAAVATTIVSIPSGNFWELSITAVGTTFPGSDLTVTIQ